MTASTVPERALPERAPRPPAFATRPVLTVAGAFVALELAVSARYGLHRDELYFLACARHLAWGYVDQPPFVPALAWVSSHLLGSSASSLRVFPAIAGGVGVALAAGMARELGGAGKAQLLAASAAATSPLMLAAFHLLSTASFDLAFWAAVSFVVLRLLRTGDQRLWLVVGAVGGIALLNKLNIAFLLAAIVAALVVDRRHRVFSNPWIWAGAAIALALWSPNIVWNARHDWAALTMLRNLHRENGSIGAVIGFVPAQLFVVGPLLAVFWLAGLRRLFTTSFARPLAVSYVILLAFFTAGGGKPYYLGGIYFLLFGAGGVWAEERIAQARGRLRARGWIAVMLAGAVSALPVALPVLPASALPTASWSGNVNKDLSATLGWRRFVAQIAGVASRLPPDQRAKLVVFTGDYGAAGAIDLWGADDGLPHAISGHNSYWWWRPSDTPDGGVTIAVNLPRSYLLTIFGTVTPAGVVTSPHGVWTEERGDPIWICTGQKITWNDAWPGARHYD